MPNTLAINNLSATAHGPQGRHHQPGAGLTVEDVARRLRVGPDKVRSWITRGELKAVNTAAQLCGKPRWVITPEAIADFEQRRSSAPAPKPRRRRRQSTLVDFYPD
jgi:excisionase family DNA binding protein